MRILAIALIGLWLWPSTSRAADVYDDVTWTLCSTGAFRSCSSVHITTSVVECASALCYPEIGEPATRVVVTLRNLQGSHALDNAYSSILEGWQFRFNPLADLGFSATGVGNQAPVINGSVGTDNGSMVRQFVGGSGTLFLEQNVAEPTVLFGCNDEPFSGDTPFVGGRTGLQTCDPMGLTGSVSFSVRFTGDFHASDLESIRVAGSVFWTPDDIDPSTLICDTATTDCHASVAPEPATIVLLGTGLLALAPALRRRRRP